MSFQIHWRRFRAFFLDVEHWTIEAIVLRWLTLFWLGIGLLTLMSASYPVAALEQGDGLYFVKRQIIFVLLGLLGANVAVNTPLKKIQTYSPIGLLFFTVLIILTRFIGTGGEEWGASRWIGFGGFSIQPSELIKPFLVLEAANAFSRWHQFKWRGRLSWVILFGIIIIGIFLQPNLSMTGLCGITLLCVAFTAGVPMAEIGGAVILGSLLIAISLSQNAYQRARLSYFLDPLASKWDEGYQLVQSIVAITSGGIWGAGFGASQQKAFFLPIQHTDFIFSVFAEEFGLIGSVALLCFLIAYGALGANVAWRSPNTRHRLIAVGATVFLIVQSLINIGVATGAFPTTGVTLPFFSYGGSSILASLALAALLIRVARENNRASVIPFLERRQAG